MESSAKIIIFYNNEDNQIWVHTDKQATVMYFSRGFNDDPDLTIKLTDNNSWQVDGVGSEDFINKTEFETTWNKGIEFINNRDKILKQQEKELFKKEIKKAEKSLRHYKEKLKKL